MMKKTFFLLFVLEMMLSFVYGASNQTCTCTCTCTNSPPPLSGYLPITFNNSSQTLSNAQVYVLIKGINPSTNKDCYVNFDSSTGVGACVDVTTGTSSYTYSFPLSQFSQTSNGNVVYLPQVNSGRIYLSLAYPLDLLVDSASHRILDPDALNTNDSNFYILYDKIEFTYVVPGNPEVDLNPTAVDFFCLPLYLQLVTNSGVQSSGFNQNRANMIANIKTIFSQNDKTPNKIWNKLIIPFKDPSTQAEIAQLRIASTGKAMTTAPVLFDPMYLSNSAAYGFNWIQNVWTTYYQSHTLNIDATELSPPNNQIFTGHVNGANQFVFTGANGSPTVTINLPSSSYPFFGAAGDSFNTSNNTPQAIIVRDLTSAAITGLLPTSSSNILNSSFFASQRSNFYTNNPLLPAAGQNTGPWYDLYSKALHSFNSNIYTFAYDDLLGTSGTVAANMSDSPSVVISLGDLTGTTIPDPFTDTTLYNITVNFSPSNPIYYQGQPLQNNQTLTNITMPFTVQLLGSDKQTHSAHIYVKYPQVRPTYPGATGIIVNKTGANSATIVFPGA